MPLPSIDELKRPTLEYLYRSVVNSDLISPSSGRDFGMTSADLAIRLESRIPTFVNNHAWALVRLQNDGLIQKTGHKTYHITDAGKAFLTGRLRKDFRVEPPETGQMPLWARRWIYVADRKNGPDGPRFTEQDLLELWRRCGGRCAVTRLSFSEEKVGLGKAKRAFAPSIDKIDPAGLYSVENCRLVMVAINFAINAWGLEVYLRLARAAVEAAEPRTA